MVLRVSYRVIFGFWVIVMVNGDWHGLGILVGHGFDYWSKYKTGTWLDCMHNTNLDGRLYEYLLCSRWFGVLICFYCGHRNIIFRPLYQ